MATSKIDRDAEGTGYLFTTPAMFSSVSQDGVPFSRKVAGVRLLPVFDKEGSITKYTVEATLADSERVVYYPLANYNDFSFDEKNGTARFTSRDQEFSITAIEDSEASQAPQEETGDITNE